MFDAYLQLSYRKGSLLAGYFYLDDPRSKSARSRKMESGLVVDFAADGHPIGVEITSPSSFSLAALNRVLAALSLAPATPTDIGPLVAA